MKEGRIQGKVAIVTGSTSGIGEAIARLFAKEGAKVVISGRRSEKGNKITEEIRQAGGEAIFVQTDVVQDDQVQALVDATLEKYGQIDILVNNAGRIIEKPFEAFTNEDWDNFVALDGRAYFKCMQLVLPHMVKRNGVNFFQFPISIIDI
jgi:NADP-dependent 3-hydroxy acid dehydrogenase YdfG